MRRLLTRGLAPGAVALALCALTAAARNEPGRSGVAAAASTNRSGFAAAATIAPLADLTARVAGPAWQVRTVVPPGRSPHVFEPTPADVRLIAPARLVVTVGAGYDDWAARLVAACASRAIIHDAGGSVGVTAEAGERGHSHGGHEHGVLGHDPHWWLSPVYAARALPPLAASLAGIDPGGRAGYERRATELAGELARLDDELARALAPLRGRAFLSAHPAWSYFAERYGLRPVGSLEPVPGREPSPADLKALIDTARRERLSALFTEPQFPESAARVLAEAAGLVVAQLDPIGGVPGREEYAELMRFNAAAFTRALGGRE